MLAAVLLSAVLVPTAPVPKDLETREKKLERLFGTPHQPEGTKVVLDGNRLKVTVPELPAGRPGEANVFASPRTARTVSGDFEFSVVVTVAVPNGQPVDSWAGVYVAGFGEKGHFDYMRWLNLDPNRKGGTGRGVWSQLCNPGQSNVVGHAEQDTATATLRVVRTGNHLAAHTKYGTGEWGQLAQVNVATMPKEVVVGVYVGGRKGPLTAEFEDFKVTKPAK